MSKLAPAFAALSVLLLCACGGQDRAAVANATVEAEANALGNASPSEPIQPGSPANAADEPVPPPDAVSHPDGYLPPPPPGEATAVNSSDPDPSPPTTEDQYMRNKQAGR